jgi:hypothetical protein
MSFSATGTALEDVALKGKSFQGYPIFDVPPLHNRGYTPIISTFSGTLRILFGVVHSIVHLAASIFDFKNGKYHIYQVGIGMVNILRGLVEIVPVFGNLTMFAIDVYRIEKTMKNEFINNFPNSESVWQYGIIAESLWKGFDLNRGAITVK